MSIESILKCIIYLKDASDINYASCFYNVETITNIICLEYGNVITHKKREWSLNMMWYNVSLY